MGEANFYYFTCLNGTEVLKNEKLEVTKHWK